MQTRPTPPAPPQIPTRTLSAATRHIGRDALRESRLWAFLVAGAWLGCGAPIEPQHSGTGAQDGGADGRSTSVGTRPRIGEVESAIEAGDLTRAGTLVDRILAVDPEDPRATFYKGVISENAGDKKGAEEAYRKALALSPEMYQAALNLSNLLAEAGRHDEVIAICREAFKRHAGVGSLHANLAVALAAKGQKAEATREFEESIRLDSRSVVLRTVYARHLLSWKERDKAIEVLKPVVGKGKFADAAELVDAAQTFYEARDAAHCIAMATAAVQVSDSKEARLVRAKCRGAAKEDALALEDLLQARTLAPADAEVHLRLGQRLWAMGRFGEAETSLEKAISLSPSGPIADLAKKALEKVRRKQAP